MPITKINEELIDLYQQMYEHTKYECSHVCKVPHSCCSDDICEMVAHFIPELWGHEAPDKTDHPKLRFMGLEGCILAPHLRGLCTVHTCAINAFGEKPKAPEWNEKYWGLRNQIDDLEGEKWMLLHKDE